MAIHYGPSSLVNTKFQAAAANLTIGMRVLPHVFVRAANAQPVEIHDLLPADSRFKILVFAGDLAREEDKAWDRSWSSWGPRLRAMSGVNLG